MKKGIHYEKLHSPVSGWSSIRILLIILELEVWKTIQVDYVQYFPQAPIEKDLYLKVPAGFQVEDGDNNDYELKLHRKIYGQKQYGTVWYKYLTKKLLMEIVFKKSENDECVFYRGSVVYILCTYDSTISVPNQE